MRNGQLTLLENAKILTIATSVSAVMTTYADSSYAPDQATVDVALTLEHLLITVAAGYPLNDKERDMAVTLITSLKSVL